MAVVPVVLIRMKRYMRVFHKAGATNVSTAIIPEEHGIRKSWVFNKLVRKGIFVPVNNERYYIDIEKETAFKNRRQSIVIVLLLLILAGIILGFLVL